MSREMIQTEVTGDRSLLYWRYLKRCRTAFDRTIDFFYFCSKSLIKYS